MADVFSFNRKGGNFLKPASLIVVRLASTALKIVNKIRLFLIIKLALQSTLLAQK